MNMEILVFMISIFPAISQAYNMHNFNTRCESLHAPMCRGLPYNKTFFPNTFNHLSQYEAQQFFTQFHALISVNCFKDIKLFLCSLFFPVCTVVDKPILPCRTLCKKARKGCQPIMKRHGYEWPAIFRCKKFPKRDSRQLCVDKPNERNTKNISKKRKTKKGQ